MKIVCTVAPPDRVCTGGQMGFAAIVSHLARRGASMSHLKAPTSMSPVASYRLARQLVEMARVEPCVLWEDYWQRRELVLANLALSRSCGIVLVGITQAFDFDYRISRLKNLLDTVVSRIFLARLDLVITSGKAATDRIVKLGVAPGKVRTVYPGLRPQFSRARLSPTDSPGRTGLAPRVLFVGRLHPVKGLEYLLRAMQLVQPQAAQLTVVTYEALHYAYSRYIARLVETLGIGDRVRFIGPIYDADQLLRTYQESDLYILPSVWETSPVSVMEAMCAGVPVVASDVGGVPELVEHGVSGLLVPAKDPQALAAAISSLLESKQTRHSMGQRGFQKASRFRRRTWARVAEDYYKALVDLYRLAA